MNEISIPTARGTESFDSFVVTNSGVINAFVEDYRRKYGSIRIHVRVDAVFTREVEGSLLQRIPAFFSSAVQDVDSTQQIDLAAVACDLSAQADHWNSRGSAFVLEHISKFVLCISKYRPLRGSTYIPTPSWLSKKKCVVNVKNFDTKCFVWFVLAALHPPKYHPDRLSNYLDYENSLNISGLSFPLAVKDVPKFEKQNLSISVSVLCRGDEGGFVPLHVSKERDRPHHVNLFPIEGADENRHYVWVKNLSRLVRGRTKRHNAAFVCNHCLHPFRNKDTLVATYPIANAMPRTT